MGSSQNEFREYPTSLPELLPFPTRYRLGRGSANYQLSMTRCCSKLGVLLLLVAAPLAATAAEIESVRLGLGGRYKLGHYTPLWITLKSKTQETGDLAITVPDGDDVPSTYTGGPLAGVSVSPGASKTIATYVCIGRREGMIGIEWSSNAGKTTKSLRIDDLSQPVLASQQRVVVIGAPIGLADAVKFLPRQLHEEISHVVIDDVATLPAAWQGYDGVDALVITAGGEAGIDRQLSERQRSAIDRWVRLGGRAMVLAGAGGEEALQPGTLLSELTPGEWSRTLPLRNTANLEQFVDSVYPLDEVIDAQDAAPLLVTELENHRGEVLLAGSGNRPQIARGVYGFGKVLFVGLDLHQAPLADWPDHPRLIAKLLDALWSQSEASEEQQAAASAVQLGFDDLTGQLRAGLDQFQGVQLIPFEWVAGLIVVYMLLIGPVDYFLLRRLGRMELTWVTFPLLAVALGAAAWFLSGWARGDSLRVNQVDLVDIDATSSLVRGTTWLRIYSPGNTVFDAQLDFAKEDQLDSDLNSMFLTWQGLPGDALGGMNDASWAAHGRQSYQLHDSAEANSPPHVQLQTVPLGVGATKGLVGRWTAQTDLSFGEELQFTSLKLIDGTVRNPLPFRLIGCMLYHDRWVYNLRTLEPGQEVTLNDDSAPLDVKWMLTNRTVIESRDVTTPWDRKMHDDVPRILRTMMFHEAAGGRGYTGLMHRYQGFVDLSGHLTHGRAVMVGRADESATSLRIDGQAQDSQDDRRWTYYRIVFPTRPVDPTASDQ